MKTRRETYTAETPTSLFPESLLTVKQFVQAPCSIGNRGSKMKCITRLWGLNIPSELLQEILSRLGLKENIRASIVCKTWCEAAVSVRKLQPRPWLLYPQEGSEDKGDYILYDPSSSQTYKFNFPELENDEFDYTSTRDGWLFMLKHDPWELLLLNPFTGERIHLPKLPEKTSGNCLDFSAAPTSSSCLVISLNYTDYGLINIWRPGETVWTTHRFKNHLENQPVGFWYTCVFSNGLFYFHSTWGFLGVMDPSKLTWNNLLVKLYPYPGAFDSELFMAEHEGEIFLGFTRDIKNPSVVIFKLNLNRNGWEETRDLDGLTIFTSHRFSLTRAGLPLEMRNKIYTSQSPRPPSMLVFPYRGVWVDPLHNVNL
ncbi:unnamed protein product [Arabis nemorensis]|uniref:F-box domain-containing protein n=1 Tax=Arabis nemorensis TaxID=586526 RepID=A0A565BD92_9BRAS|nr:unnamed protein product [Arabis nemorensis]